MRFGVTASIVAAHAQERQLRPITPWPRKFCRPNPRNGRPARPGPRIRRPSSVPSSPGSSTARPQGPAGSTRSNSTVIGHNCASQTAPRLSRPARAWTGPRNSRLLRRQPRNCPTASLTAKWSPSTSTVHRASPHCRRHCPPSAAISCCTTFSTCCSSAARICALRRCWSANDGCRSCSLRSPTSATTPSALWSTSRKPATPC